MISFTLPSEHEWFVEPVEGRGTWTKEEHSRFLEAMQLYPHGPWRSIAKFVKTRTIRQTQTHAQKYREKIARRQRGLQIKHVFSDETQWHPLPFDEPRTPSLLLSQPSTPTTPIDAESMPDLPACLDYLLQVLERTKVDVCEL
ncbi:hypothetical protein THRCLA_20726 [Thraustotheca clavata]|uniref:Uncharacterized protein n=1 Tax=Thraustotheca clavata TaxID=74557 RepID=A0A1W0A466_9STRA|nr:hypothetical protein THRCLA_20726 [Thraustotheca clavata]